jgi:hypothetical protein
MWDMLNSLCDTRKKRLFFLSQLTRLIREKKVIRYRRNTNWPRGRPSVRSYRPKEYLNWRGKIRISEAYV